jgi:predicted ferric reductase
VLMGLLVATNYNLQRQWPHRKLPVPLFRIHNWTAYVAIVVVLLHPTLLLCVREPHFRATDILWPFSSPAQTRFNVLGAGAFYGFLLVVVTSYFRPQLRHRPWKKLHYTAYAAALLLFLHATFIDPNLKNQPPDYLDGEKILVEVCFLLVVAASIWRWRRGTEKQRYLAARHPGAKR